jgi:hypothetical protein
MWNYGTFEGYPTVYDMRAAYVLFDKKDGWRKLHPAEVMTTARPMTKSDFDASFPDLPPLPK